MSVLSFLFGFIFGVLLLFFVVLFFILNLFEEQPTSKHKYGFKPISPQKTRIPNELKAFLRLCSDDSGSEWENCSSLSLLLHFLFQEHKDTRQFRRWFYKKLQLELNDITARSSTAGRIIQSIQIRDLEAGTNSPMVNKVRVESFQLSDDDPDLFEELVLLLDVDYRGGFQMSVDANMAFGKFAQLSVKLMQLNGRVRFSIRRQPFAHWSFSFIEAPQMELKIDSQFQGRNLRHLIPLINSAFRKALQLKHVWPNYKLRFRPFFQNPLLSPSPNMAAFEHLDFTGAGLEVTVLSSSRLNLCAFDGTGGRLFCRHQLKEMIVLAERRPFNPYQKDNKNAPEKLRKAAHLLSVLLQFTRKGTGDPLGLTFAVFNKEPNGRQVRVARVEPKSNAEKCGFREGDTLVAVNNIPVRNERQATRLLTGTAGDLLVLVEREHNQCEHHVPELEEKETNASKNSIISFADLTDDFEPIEYLAKDESDGDEQIEALTMNSLRSVPSISALARKGQQFNELTLYTTEERKKGMQNRKLSICSERAPLINRNKNVRRSRSESEIWNALKECTTVGLTQTDLLIHGVGREEVGSSRTKPLNEREEILSDNGSGEKERKQHISRREKLHAKANEMAVLLSKSRLNEFIWNRRKPVEMAAEAHDRNEAVETDKTESQRLEKPRRRWTRKKSPSPSVEIKTDYEQKMTNTPAFIGSRNSKCSKSVQISRNPIWGQSLHFGLKKDSLYLNVLLYATKNTSESQRNGEEETLLGWTSIYVPRIVDDCSLTLSNCHRERFHLMEPKCDHRSVPVQFDQLSRHNGFDRRLCFGDLLIAFRFFPDGLPVETNECSSTSSFGTFGQIHLPDSPSCHSLATSSTQSDHRWMPLKLKQSLTVSCGVCGGKTWLKWANQCEKCGLVCHAKCLERAQTRECHETDAFAFDDDTFIELDTDEICKPERKRSETAGNDAKTSSLGGNSAEASKNAVTSNCRKRRIAERLQTFSALTLKSVQEYSRRRTTQKGQPGEKENSASDFESPDSPKSPLFALESEGSSAMVSIAEVLEEDLLKALEGFGPNSRLTDLKFEPGNAYNPQVVCEAKSKGQHLLGWCDTEERKKRINAQIDRVQTEIEAVTRLRRSLTNKSGADFERSEHRLQALAFIMMLYCYALNDCHEKEEEEARKSKIAL